MTKETKYRAWDKARDKIFDVTLINFSEKLVNIVYDNKSDWKKTREIIKDYNVPFSRVELMEYLGVKDKKEKEICEGDIVEWTYPDIDDNYYKEKAIFGNILGVIYWNNEDCSFSIKQISVSSFRFDKHDMYDECDLEFYGYDGEEFDWNQLKVTGNIYENKEFYERELKKYQCK